MKTSVRSSILFACLAPFLTSAWVRAGAQATAREPGSAVRQARQILEAAGVRGGLIVHLGCSDGRLTAALGADDAHLVQGLDTDAAEVARARAHIHSLGCYGAVSVDRLTGVHLPYVDNLVRLVVVEDLCGVAMDEVIRVLAPGGIAYVRKADAWEKAVKPHPHDIDDWTHYLHDATGNMVVADERVGPPRHIRWAAGPLWSRSHEFNPSLNALVSAGGRMFYILDEGMLGLPDLRFPARWALYARDAYSGKLLWK
jgi:SAM-dependent methyltransferase